MRAAILTALGTFAALLLVPLLFAIGEQRPAYTVTSGLWLFGVAVIGVPAALGYLAGMLHDD